MFEGPAWLVSQYYSLTHNYAAAIGLVALTVMILVTPLTLKSTKGIVYAALVVVLGLLYFAQQKMVASRAAVSPTMSATQAKLMQYLPVVFAVFQIFFLTGLVIYYITQAIFRIGQNAYITKRFYSHEHSLGKKAQAASLKAREEAKANGTDKGAAAGGGGMFAQAKRDAQ